MTNAPSPDAERSFRIRRLLFTVLMLAMGIVHTFLTTESAYVLAVTVDEFGHVPVGYNVLTTGDFGFCELNPPLMNVLAALPLRAWPLVPSGEVGPLGRDAGYDFWGNGYRFMDLYRRDYLRAFFLAREASTLAAAFLGLLAGLWAIRFDTMGIWRAALLAMGLVWFSPNLLAHASLATTDMGAAFSFGWTLLAAHAWFERPTRWRAAVLGVVLGLAQLVKFSAVLLFPLLLVPGVGLLRTRRAPVRRVVAGLALALALCLLVINAGYLFQRTGRPLGSFSFRSPPFASLQAHLPRALPVPLPESFVRAFDRQLFDAREGDPSYLLGQPYFGGRWDYFLTLLLLKVPVPLVLLALAAVAVRIVGRRLREEDAFLLLPALFVLVIFSFFSQKQLGLRMILPAAPLFWIWVSVALSRVPFTVPRAAVLAALMGWLGVEVARVRPDPLGYFNGLAQEPGGYPLAGDSNLDWGQGLTALADFLHTRGEAGPVQLYYFGRVDPALYGIDYVVPERVQPGLVVVSASLFTRPYVLYDHGQLVEQPRLSPVPARFHLVTRLMHSLYVYKVDPPGK